MAPGQPKSAAAATPAKPVVRLDHTIPQKVAYCIPEWLRDEQVKLAVARDLPRLKHVQQRRSEPVAVVCYGPSLNDTWERVKEFRYVISCSGAHKFLIERGIIPVWHVEVDPRPHKTLLIGQPHNDVTYLVASTCHPALFEHLSGFNVRLWHVFSNDDDALRLLPRGEWALTGGSSVGLRAMTMAKFLGFTDLHVFGMDGCEGQSGKHASEHPNQPKGYAITEYNGVEYKTTPAMLECARQTFHELDQMPGVTARFYGEGLVQAMARDYKRKVTPDAAIGVAYKLPVLISPEYRDMNARLHKDNLFYGVGGGRHADVVLQMAHAIGTQSILDYGCGKGYLAKAIPFPIWEYDPAVPGKQESPRPADLVVCTDVLEHIEPDNLRAVLADLRRCVLKVGFFVIHMGPASKTLADGRNTHLIQRGPDWWTRQLSRYFVVGKAVKRGAELAVVVGPRKMKHSKVIVDEYNDKDRCDNDDSHVTPAG